MTKALPLFVLIFSALGARTVSSHTLSAPSTVYADQDGDFSYRFTCTITPDSVVVAGIGWSNGSNVTGAEHGDCLCVAGCKLGPGTEMHYDVSGSLVEQQLPGAAENWVAFCGDPNLRSVTTVMPYDPAPALATTWGRIKALYRR